MEDDLNSSKNLLNKNQFIERKDFDNKIFEQLNESEPLFELIKQHKKRLLEIKDWKYSFNNSHTNHSEITYINGGKNVKDDIINNKISKFSREEEKKIGNENIENNIKLVKDFLKINSLNKSNNMNTDNNEESSTTINNINLNYNNIINTNDNMNDNSYSILKESSKNDTESNKFMKTGINFNKKLNFENIKSKNNYNSKTINSFLNRNNVDLIIAI